MDSETSLVENPGAGINLELIDEMMLACRKLRTLFDNRTRSIGLTLSRARALMRLNERDMMSQTELANILAIEGPTLVRLLDGLQKQGLVERREQERDRRVKQVALTAKGRATASKIAEIVASIRAELLRDMDDVEITRSTVLMRQINVNLDVLAADAVRSVSF